jgi:hypothetical protein
MITSSQVPQEEALSVNSTFRRRYGIPPKGTAPKGGWADSDYGFPLPPADHPKALEFAHAVLSRAHQNGNFDPADVAKQVAKAKRIVAQHNQKKDSEAVTPWRDVRWINLAQRRGKGFAAVHPRKSESVRAFLERCPHAAPASRAAKLSDEQLRVIRESAVAIRNGSVHLEDWSPSNVSLREAKAGIDKIEGVLLIRSGPGNPADGHYYSDECITNAAATNVFEGAQCYLDHSSAFEEKNRPERSVKDLAGWYSDVKAKPYKDPQVGPCIGLFATFHPAAEKPEVLSIVRTCVEYAKQYPRKAYAGLSISAYGDGEPDEINGKEYLRVDTITAVQSVDIVTRAGAGGAIVPLREGFRVATGSNNIKLTLNEEKIREGLTELNESQKTKVRAFLKGITIGEGAGAAKLELTAEQDKELDRVLGIVDGGALDQVLDKATGVSNEEDDEVEEGAKGGSGGETDDDPPEIDEAAIKKMSPAQLAAAFKKERARREAAEKKVEKSDKKVAEAARASEQASLVVREHMADNVMAELNIPEAHRPRLKRELIREGYTTDAKMRTHVKEYDVAIIRGGDGSGNAGGGSASGGDAKKITLSFTE